VAVLERQDTVDRDTSSRVDRRIAQLEALQHAIVRMEGMEAQVAKLSDTVANRAASSSLDAAVVRISALETEQAKGEGMSKALIVGWTMLTAAPGLVGLAIALWKLGH